MKAAGTSISVPYLLVINIPLYRDPAGHWWGDPLWVKDLLLHTEGIDDLRLVCPQVSTNEPGWVRVETHEIAISGVIAPSRMWWWRATHLYRKIDAAVAQATIVHCGVAGWPYPLGWLAGLASLKRKRFLMIVVESSFWRIPRGHAASLVRRLQALLFEAMARFLARRANLLVVTQPEYSLLAGSGAPRSFVNPATWIDDEFILTPQAADDIWKQKQPRLLYAGRLTAEKGVGVLLEALRTLGISAPAIDIIGEGELLAECRELAARMPQVVRVLSPVAYGRQFFELLDSYRAIIVPIRSDEQPRIVFDAYARAMPVFGSDAVGVASCVIDGLTGSLHRTGSAESLARSLLDAADTERLHKMGLNALLHVRSNTHRNMHRLRIERLQQTLQDWLQASRRQGTHL